MNGTRFLVVGGMAIAFLTGIGYLTMKQLRSKEEALLEAEIDDAR